MNLKSLSDEKLEFQIKDLVQREREMLVQILEHLREVQVRRIDLARGYGSMFEYATKELGYSEAAAARRLAAMQLIRAVPEVAQKIEAGTLNLSNVAMVHAFFKREEKVGVKSDKREVIAKIENVSRRECERILAEQTPEAAPPRERERVLHDGKTEIVFVATPELMAKFEKLKSLLSHRIINPSYAELFEAISDELIKRIDPARETRRKQKTTPPAESEVERAASQDHADVKRARRPAMAAALRREIWRRDAGCCQHQDAKTGRRCGSTFQVQVDHIIPRARGGEDTHQNLELVCRGHNILRAYEKLGARVMERFGRRRRTRIDAHQRWRRTVGASEWPQSC